jgi:hypothetical protein
VAGGGLRPPQWHLGVQLRQREVSHSHSALRPVGMVLGCEVRRQGVTQQHGSVENGGHSAVTVVYTIGYEGTDINRFVDTLKAVGVTAVADVRAIALSRKRGFSKFALQTRLREEGIAYVHFVDLGDPKPGRDAARAGRYDIFRKIYTRHLEKLESEAALSSLAELVATERTCLLCFERDPSVCHRSLITNRFRMDGAEVRHLCVDDPSRYVHYASKLPSRNTRQGAPAA